MQLKTLLGTKKLEIQTEKANQDWLEPGDLKKKYKGICKKLGLKSEYKNGLSAAYDQTGTMLYKRIKDFEWFFFEPSCMDLEDLAEFIYIEMYAA